MTEERHDETISAEKLKEAGYTSYKERDQEFGDMLFQKSFKDKHGTKYFINCKYFFYTHNEKRDDFWEFSMQLQAPEGTVNFTTIQWFNQNGIYTGKTIKDVEEYFAWLWEIHGKPYYEVY